MKNNGHRAAAIGLKDIFLVSVVILMFVVMVINFYQNSWGIAEKKWFDGWQSDSQMLVEKKIVDARIHGVFNNYGLMGKYTQQIGLQAISFSVLEKIVPLKPDQSIKLMYLINAVLLSGMIFLLLFWLYKEFGVVSAFLAYIAGLFSPWTVVSARNLYWVTWTFLLPFIAVLYILWHYQNKSTFSQWKMMLVVFITIFIRSACGYEFISYIMIGMELPFIYFALKDRWKLILFLKRAGLAAVAALTGFAFAVMINIAQVTAYLGSFKKAIENLAYTISKRTGAFDIKVEKVYLESITAPIRKVISSYLYKPMIFGMDICTISLGVLAISCICLAIYLVSKKSKYRNKLIALSVMTIVSSAGPLSWYILAKGHSYIHTHINFILWGLPFTMLAFALAGAVVPYIFYRAAERIRVGSKKTFEN